MHPPVAAILARTLRLGDDPDPDALAAAWPALPTRHLDRLVTAEGCALWLYRRLADGGASADLPAAWRQWLATHAQRELAQNLRVEARALALTATLHQLQQPHVLLKGAALQALHPRFAYADARLISDVDLLVPAPTARDLWQRLQAHGYAPVGPPELFYEHHHHLQALHAGDGVQVEIHVSTYDGIDATEAWRRFSTGAHPVSSSPAAACVPADTELLWHGLAHSFSQTHNQEALAFQLRALLDGAALLAGDHAIDWDLIAARLAADERPGRVFATRWLAAAAWLARTELPAKLGTVAAPYDVTALLAWRLTVARYWRDAHQPGESFLAEGARVAAGIPPRVRPPQLHGLRGLLFTPTAHFARLHFRLWRTLCWRYRAEE